MMRQAATIMCVTRDDALTRLVRTALAGTGMTLLPAPTPAHALALVQAHRPDLILLDVALIEATGQGLLATAQATSPVPVLIVSARRQDILAFCGPGAAHVLVTKPCTIPMLLARLAAGGGPQERETQQDAAAPRLAQETTVVSPGAGRAR